MAVEMPEQTGNQVPLLEERLSISPDGAHLWGVRCERCSLNIFPPSELCPNCGVGGVERVALSTRGKVWTYTVVHQSYGSVALEPPYVASFVELDDGAFVHTPVVGCPPEDVEIGMEVELALLKAGKQNDRDAMVYAFRPVR